MPSLSTTNAHGTCVPWVTGSLAALLVVLHIGAAGVFGDLVYDRTAILNGEVWRVLTGHLVHLDWNHLALNALALLGLGYLIETDGPGGRRNVLAVLGASIAAIGAALLVFHPMTILYAGLSGALNGLFAFICLRFFARTRSWIWLALLAGGICKIAWESAFGPAFSATLAWPPEALAHFAGLFGGFAVAAVNSWRRAKQSWYFGWAACPFNPA
ncbi:MAG: rhombosortase [Rhizobiales bacterium]|nr:rhombosortase [Hyphomicrobiales bacterium]